MSTLQPITYLQEVIPGCKRATAYRIAAANPEITCRIGRRVFIVPEKLEAWIADGGSTNPLEAEATQEVEPVT